MKEKETNFDFFANSYQGQLDKAIPFGGGKADKYTRIKAAHLKDCIKKYLDKKNNLDILDAGCGIGLTDKILKKIFPSLAGFDISKESVFLAKKRNPEIEYRVSNGIKIPFCNEQFDLAFAICVLHHINPSKRPNFFNEIYRVLRPKGFFFIYEHNPWNPLTRLTVTRCPFDQNAVLLSNIETRQLLIKAGFEPRQSGSLIFLPTELPVWRRFENLFLSKIPFGAQYFESGIKAPKPLTRV